MLTRYHELAPWEGDVIGTELTFEVPLGDHVLTGTIDKLVSHPGQRLLTVLDYKTGSYVPEKLKYNLQFTAYCMEPDTPVLMDDYSWKPIKAVGVGDSLIGFDEESSRERRRWRQARVVAAWRVKKPSYRISFEDGRTLVASEDHRWLSVPVSHSMKGPWFRTDELTVGQKMSAVFDSGTTVDVNSDDYQDGYLAGANLGDGSIRVVEKPKRAGPRSFWNVCVVEEDRAIVDRCYEYLQGLPVQVPPVRIIPNTSQWGSKPMALLNTNSTANVRVLEQAMTPRDTDEWVAGWLAGLYDTDGSFGGGQIYFYQKDESVLEQIVKYGARWGFDFVRDKKSVRLRGDRMERVRFLALIAPALDRKIEKIDGRTVRIATPAVISSIEFLGERELVDITTTSRTFVADGFLVHNCYATERPEFWEQNGHPDDYFRYAGWRRSGEWFHARNTKVFNAGYRSAQDYKRLRRMADEMERSIEQNIFLLDYSGESCGYCAFVDICGDEVEDPRLEGEVTLA